MTTIKITKTMIECSDHAGDRVKCAMLSALTVSLIENLTERLALNIEYSLRSGYFYMDLRHLDAVATTLVDSYIYSLISLSNSFPDNFSLSIADYKLNGIV